MDLKALTAKIKENILQILLAVLGLCYLYLASMPKHGDFWTIFNWSAIFAQDPLHYMDRILSVQMIQIYPPAFNIIQGFWIMLGEHIFNYDTSTFTFWVHPPIFPLWGMIPTIAILCLFAGIAYLTLKNKWLSILCFGTLTFISVIIMGQVDIWYSFLIFLSMICLLKAFESEKFVLLIALSMLFLGLSLTFKMFGGLLLPIYLLFIANVFVSRKIQLSKAMYLIVIFFIIFAIGALAVWAPYTQWFTTVYAKGESNWLFNLQITGPYPVHTIYVWLIGYMVILYGAFRSVYKNITNLGTARMQFIFFCFLTVAWLFITVYSHPQWWVLLLPPVLLLLDNFKSRLHYLFAFGLFIMFIYFPMIWVDNIDMILPYYVPTLSITGGNAILFTNLMSALLILWVIHAFLELKEPAGVASDNSKPVLFKYDLKLEKIAPLMITFLPFIFCLIVGFILMGTIGYEAIGGSNPNQPAGGIYGSTEVGQTFVAKYNNLNSVNVYMAAYGHQDLKDIIFHLKNSPSASEDIATVLVKGSELKENTYVKFKFAPIQDSGNKQYYFMVESPEAAQDKAITIWYNGNDTYQSGIAYLDNQAMSGDLAFTTSYRPSISDLIGFIGNKYPKSGNL